MRIALAIAILAVGLGGMAVAQEDERENLRALRDRDPVQFRQNVKERLATIKSKNPELFERIVQRIIRLRNRQKAFLLKHGDTDGDGKLSDAERTALEAKREALMATWEKEPREEGDWADISDALEDVCVPKPPPPPPDRLEDRRDRREDVRDAKEDVRDAQHDGGVRDRLEDRRDRREDVRDAKEDVRDAKDLPPPDRLEDRRDRREDVRDAKEDVRDAQHDGGVRDRVEDRRDRREDVRDRREDAWDAAHDWNDGFFKRRTAATGAGVPPPKPPAPRPRPGTPRGRR